MLPAARIFLLVVIACILSLTGRFTLTVIKIKGFYLLTAWKDTNFPSNSKGVLSKEPPKIIFDATFVDLDKESLQFVVDWKLKPADGACVDDAPPFIADVMLDPTTLYGNNRSETERPNLNPTYELFSCFQYNSKDACAGLKNDTFDFTVIWKILPDITGVAWQSNDPKNPGLQIKLNQNDESLSGRMFFQAKDNSTGEYVPFKLNKAQGLPVNHNLTIDSFWAVESDNGMRFKFHASKKISVIWEIFYNHNTRIVKLMRRCAIALVVLLPFCFGNLRTGGLGLI